MPTLSVFLLGPFTAAVGGSPLNRFRTKSGQGLLIYLAVEGPAGKGLQREFLAELLYPGLQPQASKKNLRQTLYELRQLVAQGYEGKDPLILANRQTVSLNPQWSVELDVTNFETAENSDDLARLEYAAGLYRGDFLSDFYLPDSSAFEDWAGGWRAFYRRLAAKLFERLSEAFLTSGAYDQAEMYARRQLALDDLNEPAARQLMRALAAQDQRSGALTEYQDLQRRLDKALEVAPVPETVALFRRIQAGEIDLENGAAAGTTSPAIPIAVDEPAVQVDRPVANNLPPQPTPFVGREEELAEISRLFAERSPTRLVTLLGPGGSGKSRLAIEAARRISLEISPDYPDGIWFVPLDALPDPEAVVTAIGTAIKMVFTSDEVPRIKQLIDYLAQKKLFLVLDNYEHLLANDRLPLPAEILKHTGQVSMLITSRARLNIHGEHLLMVRGLSLPAEQTPFQSDGAAGYSAIALFIQSARRLKVDFEVNKENWPEIVRIGHLVQGLPLAIELAATWLEVISPDEIREEIERSLDILTVDWSDIPERQRSMRAVFDSSWQLLSAAEQHTLQRLSVFRGGFSRAAAEAVGAADLRMLLALVNKSWLLRRASGDYQLHELLRQYSLERLRLDEGEYGSARNDHAHYFAILLGDLGTAIRGHGQKKALQAIGEAFENIRLAWAWLAVAGEVSRLTRQMLPALLVFCKARSRAEDMLALIGTAQGALREKEMDGLDAAILETAALAFYTRIYTPHLFETMSVGFELPTKSTEFAWAAFKATDPRSVDGLWPVLATLFFAWNSKQKEKTVPRLQELIKVYQDQGITWSQAFAMKYLGLIHGPAFNFIEQDNITLKESRINIHDSAQKLQKAALIFERLGDRLEQADSLRLLGSHHFFREPDLAIGPLQQAKNLFEEMGDKIMAADILARLALKSIWLGDYATGFAYYKEQREALEKMGNRQRLARAMSHEAILASRYASVDHARRLRLRCQELFAEFGSQYDLSWNHWELGEIERVGGNLQLALDYFYQAHNLFLQEDIVLGLAFYARGMGDISLMMGDSQAAVDYFHTSLEGSLDQGHRWAQGYGLSGLGRAYLSLGQHQEALRCFFEGLHLTQDYELNDLSLIALAGLARFKAISGAWDEALLLATFVAGHRLTWLETKAQVQEVIKEVESQLGEDTAKAARQQGRSLTLEEILKMVYAWKGPG